ncbi:hypothetical protein B0T18DRAFT_41545 [Schizothecium vesticola]|uniref:Uncharacterized protein n=1 Tax=Schizothecium vesticola TaxID=314040 RepID=A0AA40KD00_9PEZI|nr:hypothetical protein B0T18DRAFT_41545 [Schizothecium vesticola]
MICSRPGWLILLRRMPGIQGTGGSDRGDEVDRHGAVSKPGSGCGRCAGHYQTLLSVLIHLQCPQPSLHRLFTTPNRHDAASPGWDSRGSWTRQPEGSRTPWTPAWGLNTPAGNLRTITPISMAGQIPAFDFVTLGLAVNCSCPAWPAADLGSPSESSESGTENGLETWTNTTTSINHPATTGYLSDPLTGPDPITNPNSNCARLAQRSLAAHGSPMEPSCHRLLVCYRRLPVCHWAHVMEETWCGGVSSSPSLSPAAPRCCAAWETWDLETCLVLGADLFFRSCTSPYPVDAHTSLIAPLTVR